MDAEPARFATMLERLRVPRGRILYVQSSMDWVGRAGYASSDVLGALIEWVKPAGTLVMPSYPSALPHVEYLATHPTFDARRTPTISGLLPEMLRRTAGAVRSLDPDFPISALGNDAALLAGSLPVDADPFGPDSPYQRMLDRRTVLLGLGVSLNTSSFIHVIDSRASDTYPLSTYDPTLFATTVIDTAGIAHAVLRRAIRPPFQKLTAPSAVIDAMRPDAEAFTTVDVEGVRFFRWDLEAWSSWCLAHAGATAAEGRWPCWLTRLSDAA